MRVSLGEDLVSRRPSDLPRRLQPVDYVGGIALRIAPQAIIPFEWSEHPIETALRQAQDAGLEGPRPELYLWVLFKGRGFLSLQLLPEQPLGYFICGSVAAY